MQPYQNSFTLADKMCDCHFNLQKIATNFCMAFAY